MTQTDRVYTSDQNGDTAQECIKIDILKLLKDKIAFLRSELSREMYQQQFTKCTKFFYQRTFKSTPKFR